MTFILNYIHVAHHNSLKVFQLKIHHLYGTFNFMIQCIKFVWGPEACLSTVLRNTVFAVARIRLTVHLGRNMLYLAKIDLLNPNPMKSLPWITKKYMEQFVAIRI